MPKFGKSILSKFMRTNCPRQLRLSLSMSDAAERARHGMPGPQPPRSALLHAGQDWERRKLLELEAVFGADMLLGARDRDEEGRVCFRQIPLADALAQAGSGGFLCQASYDVQEGTPFSSAFGLDELRARHHLVVSDVVPDLLMVVPSDRPALDGSPAMMVSSSGEQVPVAPDDPRLGLRVIDIKMTADVNPGYLAEVAYYSLALAGWLEACRGSVDPVRARLADRFYVLADGAIWPGKHEASAMANLIRRERAAGGVPDPEALLAAFGSELEAVTFDVFVGRLRSFFKRDLPHALQTPWRDLAWHVDVRCQSCDFLGFEYPERHESTADANHCMPLAKRTRHISSVPFLSRGARQALEAKGITTVEALASLPADSPVFQQHQALRTRQAIIRRRAAVLAGMSEPHVAPDAGTSAVMPKFAHLKIFLTASYDLGSQLTLAFGISAFWHEARVFGDPRPWDEAEQLRLGPRSFIVDTLAFETEQREFIAAMEFINDILRDQRIRESDGLNGRTSTYQIYVWDSATAEHLRRVAGRHLAALQDREELRHLSALFPSASILRLSDTVSRRSPITAVQDVVKAVLAVDVPHYYSLLNVARVFHPENIPPDVATFRIPYMFEDGFSDLIPSERAHEIWSKSTHPSWVQRIGELERTLSRRLAALAAVTRRLEQELRETLTGQAPEIPRVCPEEAEKSEMNADSRLWVGYSALNNAVSRMDVDTIRAMAPHEREARFKSARLDIRLTGDEAAQACDLLGVRQQPDRWVYRIGAGSTEVSLREGDYDWALCPENNPGLLERFTKDVVQIEGFKPGKSLYRMENVLSATVVAVDRVNRLLVLDVNKNHPGLLEQIEATGVLDLSREVTLDPVHLDYFQRKLTAVLKVVGTPDEALQGPLNQGPYRSRNGKPSFSHPVAEVLWKARAMSEGYATPPLDQALLRLKEHGVSLNPSQVEALRNAISRRLCLIWGPPGTGKSETLAAIVLASLLDAQRSRKRLRILVTAFTWTAIDNVLRKVSAMVGRGGLQGHVGFHRVRSASVTASLSPELEAMDLPLTPRKPSNEAQALRDGLTGTVMPGAPGLYVIGATSHQAFNLVASGDKERSVDNLFDLVLIDEGSQMDVANAIVALSSLGKRGRVVCAGDHLQLAPIHPAEPPEGPWCPGGFYL